MSAQADFSAPAALNLPTFAFLFNCTLCLSTMGSGCSTPFIPAPPTGEEGPMGPASDGERQSVTLGGLSEGCQGVEHTCIQTDGQTDRQTDRQADGQTDRQTDRQAGRQTARQPDSQTDITPVTTSLMRMTSSGALYTGRTTASCSRGRESSRGQGAEVKVQGSGSPPTVPWAGTPTPPHLH